MIMNLDFVKTPFTNNPSMVRLEGDSGNVVSRSLLIEGIDEIFLITTRVSIIGTLLFIHYLIFNRDQFDKKLLKEASTTALS